MAKTKIPSSNPIGLRRNELGEVSGTDNSYGFSRAVRGYDPKEVDEYIDNLLDNYRNAQRVLDQNREEFENERELISCEVDGLKSQKAEFMLEKAIIAAREMNYSVANDFFSRSIDQYENLGHKYDKEIDIRSICPPPSKIEPSISRGCSFEY